MVLDSVRNRKEEVAPKHPTVKRIVLVRAGIGIKEESTPDRKQQGTPIKMECSTANL